jgi:hypothetical protein
MQKATTVRVSTQTRDALRALADHDGVTLDEEIQRLARSERQRRMGRSLAVTALTDDDRAWLDVTVSDATHHARR